MVERIVARGKEVNKDRVFIPTDASFLSRTRAHSSDGIYVAGFQSRELIVKSQLLLGDVTIDGADE